MDKVNKDYLDKDGLSHLKSKLTEGHVVKNDGVVFTNRKNLIFKNAKVVDDPEHDATLIFKEDMILVEKPTVTVGSYTYTGEEQGPVVTGFDPDTMAITNAKGVNAGDYILRIELLDTTSTVWEDFTTAPLTFNYSIEKASFTSTATVSSYTYSETKGTAAVSNNPGNGTVTFYGRESETGSDLLWTTITSITFNAGTRYIRAVIAETDNFLSCETPVSSFTIAKKTLQVPTVTNTSKTYNGSSQSPTITGFDANTMTKTGDSGVNAGSYTVSFTLKDVANYQWNSSTTSFSWSIARATGSLTLNKTSVALTNSSKTASITVSKVGDGSITISSSNTSVATVSPTSLSGNGSFTITGVSVGSASTATNAGHATTADTATSAASATNAASATYAGRLRIYENFYVKEFTIANVNNQGSLDITLPGMVPIGIVGWSVGNQQIVLQGSIRQGSYHRDDYWNAGPESGYSGSHHYLDYWGYNPSMQSVSTNGSFRIMYFRDYNH